MTPFCESKSSEGIESNPLPLNAALAVGAQWFGWDLYFTTNTFVLHMELRPAHWKNFNEMILRSHCSPD
jgi:hypothetical protein